MTFKIHTLPNDVTFDAEPEETLLEAALRQGITLPHGCRNGHCGSCAAQLVSGWIQYPSGLITALEGKKAGTCLTCQAVATSDLVLEVKQRPLPADLETRSLPCRVERMERLNHDVMRLMLKPPKHEGLEFLPGQYLELVLRDGRKRAFSIASAPRQDALIELHVRHAPGGGFTQFIFEELQEKSILRVEAPLGGFFLREDSQRPILMMAGGTGIAPLKAMLEHADRVGLERPIHLYWGVRSSRDLYLAEPTERWAQGVRPLTYTPVLSEPDADWTGRTGLVHEAVIADHPELTDFDVYMSGPPAMVEAARSAFEERGLTLSQMFSDAFTSPTHREGARDRTG